MKKITTLALSFFALPALAQEAEPTAFYQDTTFLMLTGGAVILIIALIIKKAMDKRASKELERDNNYEDTNI